MSASISYKNTGNTPAEVGPRPQKNIKSSHGDHLYQNKYLII
jgi:hypothetical protein